LETFFETVATQNGKPIYGLDNVGETMYMIFDREPFHWQCTELKKIVESPEKEVRLEKMLVDMYRYGRLSDIAYTIKGPDNLTTLSYSDYQIYAKRNKQWVKRLQPFLKEGKAFITLNAIYLGGDQGLLAQLREAGYKVKAVNK
jgi:uncharacterized protein YbaP (TraB family)